MYYIYSIFNTVSLNQQTELSERLLCFLHENRLEMFCEHVTYTSNYNKRYTMFTVPY